MLLLKHLGVEVSRGGSVEVLRSYPQHEFLLRTNFAVLDELGIWAFLEEKTTPKFINRE